MRFRFYTADEASSLIRDWRRKIGLEHFHPIGSFVSGDFVCAHSSGVLFVVLHDTFEWWDSDIPFDEFIRQLDADDEDLEERVYSKGQNV
jgi:hypothetical protein